MKVSQYERYRCIFHGFFRRIILYDTIYFVNFEFAPTTLLSTYLLHPHSPVPRKHGSRVQYTKNHLKVWIKKLTSHSNEQIP